MLPEKKKQGYTPEGIENRVERYWNKRSRDFSRLRRQELQGPDGDLWLDLMESHLPKGRPLRILDAGTGAGFFALLLARRGHRVTGIDLSPDMIREAKKNMLEAGCRAEFFRMSAQELDFSSETFDGVVSRNLTWTLPDVMEAYREWYRVLKPGGVLLNFDSDCGQMTFSKQEDPACVHAGIEQEMLDECNGIKESLLISTHRRPAWDVCFLRELGFSVEFDQDVSRLVRRDENLRYESAPIFGIYGMKRKV